MARKINRTKPLRGESFPDGATLNFEAQRRSSMFRKTSETEVMSCRDFFYNLTFRCLYTLANYITVTYEARGLMSREIADQPRQLTLVMVEKIIGEWLTDPIDDGVWPSCLEECTKRLRVSGIVIGWCNAERARYIPGKPTLSEIRRTLAGDLLQEASDAYRKWKRFEEDCQCTLEKERVPAQQHNKPADSGQQLELF